MIRFLLLTALAVLLALPLAAQPDLGGVFALPTGETGGGTTNTQGWAISLINPDAAAPHRVGVTVDFYRSMQRADTLGTRVRGFSGFNYLFNSSFNPSLSASGRMAFVANWFGTVPGEFQVMAVDRDGRNVTVLTDLITASSNNAFLPIRPEISPDGDTILYTLANQESYMGTPNTMFVVPSDGSAAPTPFAFAPLTACEQGAARAAFSPDGSQIAYLGWMQTGTGADATCELALRAMAADGSGDRVVYGPIDRGIAPGWARDEVALDWKANRILFSWPTVYPNATGPLPRRVSVADVTSGEIAHEVEALTDIDFDSYQLSPDGLAVGYMAYSASIPNRGQTYVVVRRLSDGAVLLDFESVYQGRNPFFDWADAPAVPAPVALEFRQDVLLWCGREVNLAPRVLDADGNVISYVVDTWSYERSGASITVPTMNHFTNRIWADGDGSAPGSGTGNGFGNSLCAQAAGFETCRTHNVVNTPVFDIEVLDDDIAEAGRNPGRIRVYRYGPHDETATPQLIADARPARHYLDYTLSTLPGVYRWAASSNMADTLQVRDITLTPVDDAVAEPEIEEGYLYLQCSSFPNEANSNCANAPPGVIPGVTNGLAGQPTNSLWRFAIQSNGAGSGLALASSTPGLIPATGRATLTINGQGLVAGATARLSGPSTVDAVNVTVRQQGVQALARFELADAPAGTYDLTVTSGGQTATLSGAVTVDATVPGGTTNVWAVLQSRSSRRGLKLTQFIHYGNDGTADAELTPMLIAVPEGFEPEFRDGQFFFPDMPADFDASVSPWNDERISASDVPGLCTTSRVQGTINCELIGGLGTEVGYKVAVVFLPSIPPGGRGTLAIDMTRGAGATTRPWFVKVGAPFNTLRFDGEGGANGLLAQSFAASGPQTVQPINVNGCSDTGLIAQSGMIDTLTPARAAACATCLGAVLSTIVENSSYSRCAKAAVDLTINTYNLFISSQTDSDGTGVAASGTSTLVSIAKTAAACGSSAFPAVGALIGLYDAMSSLSNISACADCFGIGIWDIVGMAVTADPNDKRGPTGIGQELYVAELGRMGYTIRFENLPSATAAVVELVIADTLDTSVYDLSTFQVGPITLPDTTFTPPSGLRAWTTFWDRRPTTQSIVRVNVDLDDQTGIVTWTLSDLDPNSYELLTTAEAGFLPPNDANASGEGNVQFVIRAKNDLPDGTLVANGATILFDRNEPISTPVWGNTLDLSAPTSRASSVTPLPGDTTYVVHFTGSDTGAGVQNYDVFAQAPGGPFIYAGATRSDSLVFEGEAGVVYGLFSLATDRVGNVEGLKFAAEIFTNGIVDAEPSANVLPDELTLAPPYPNPSRGSVMIQVGLPSAGPVNLSLYDVRGREVAQVFDGDLAAGWHPQAWDVGSLPSGVYMLMARTDTGTTSVRMTVAH